MIAKRNDAFRKQTLNLWQTWMEGVLEGCQRSYDLLCPVVCLDETNKQLIKETRIPCQPGQPGKVDSVYVRNGVADIFVISEPLAGRGNNVVTQTRAALDFADILRFTSDTLYPEAEKKFLLPATSRPIPRRHCIRHLRQKKPAGWHKN